MSTASTAMIRPFAMLVLAALIDLVGGFGGGCRFPAEGGFAMLLSLQVTAQALWRRAAMFENPTKYKIPSYKEDEEGTSEGEPLIGFSQKRHEDQIGDSCDQRSYREA